MPNILTLPYQLTILSGLLFFLSFNVFAQVGVGTLNPESTLDVRAVNHNGAVSAADGVLMPRVNSLDTNGSQDGQLVYLIENTGNFKKGFHYWDGGKWKPFSPNSSSSVAESIVNPDVIISSAISFPFSTPTPIPDNSYVDIPIAVSGITGTTSLVTIIFNISHIWVGDVAIYLRSPTGQNLRLTYNNGYWNEDYINTNFTDAATINITAGTAPFTGDFKPQGGGSGTVSTLAGFNGFDPNGTWIIRVQDIESIISGTLNNFTLSISGNPSSWVSLGEVVVNYLDDTAIIVQSTYSGDPMDLNGVKTALTRSTSSVAPGTSATTLPGNVLNYASASPSGTNNSWVNTFNQARNVGLVHNTTYYYQLWRQGNIEAPVASNETFSIVPIRIQQ